MNQSFSSSTLPTLRASTSGFEKRTMNQSFSSNALPTLRASTSGFEKRSRTRRTLRKFASMNESTRRFQPVVKKYTPQVVVDDDATVLTENSLLSSHSSSFSFDDSMSLGRFLDNQSTSSLSRSSSRCSFTPASCDDSFDWEELEDNEDDLSCLSLSIRPVDKKRTVTRTSSQSSQKEEVMKKNAGDAVKDFVKDRINMFNKNMDFLARKFEWKG